MDMLVKTIRLGAVGLAILLFFYYRPETPELVGHWHLRRITPDTGSYSLPLATIDVLNDSTVMLNRFVRFGGMTGYLDPDARTLRFGSECMVLNFRYRFQGRQFFLEQEEFGDSLTTTFLASRCAVATCDLEQMFFSDAPVALELPILEKDHSIPSEKINHGFIGAIDIGIPKNRTDYGDRPRLVLGDKCSTVQELDLWKAKHLIKLPEGRRDRWRVVLYADRKTDMRVVFPVLLKLREIGETDIYLAGKEPGTTFKVRYHRLKLDPVWPDRPGGQPINLETWLSQR